MQRTRDHDRVDGEKLDEGENFEESYIDDVNGGFLDREMVREARVEESAGYLAMHVLCRVPVAECGSHTVIKTRWVDTKKGDERSPEIRCRLVAKEAKKRNNTEEESANIFASTLPLEAVKFLSSEATTQRVSRNGRLLKLSFVDVKRNICVVKCCVSCMLNLHLKQTNHPTLYGDCNEPRTARVMQQLHGNKSGRERWTRLDLRLV